MIWTFNIKRVPLEAPIQSCNSLAAQMLNEARNQAM